MLRLTDIFLIIEIVLPGLFSSPDFYPLFHESFFLVHRMSCTFCCHFLGLKEV